MATQQERLKARSLLREADARIRQAETLAWTVPGLAIAAESFLLAAALNRSSAEWAQLVAAGAGVVVLLAALHFLGKHHFNFAVYEAVIDRSREALDLPYVQMSQLVGRYGATDAGVFARSFPAHTDLVRKGWLVPNGSRWRRSWKRLRNRCIRGVPSVWVWTSAIAVLIAIDVAVAVHAIVRPA